MGHADENLTPDQPRPRVGADVATPGGGAAEAPVGASAGASAGTSTGTSAGGQVWPMTLHLEGAGKAPAAAQSGWKLPPSPWDAPMPGMDHKRAPLKPSQTSPWPGATVATAATSTEAGNQMGGQAGGHANAAEQRVRASLAVDKTGLVIVDLICRRCGYALRGLNGAGKCPECGVDVSESLKSDQLLDADAEWLGRVASGLRWTWILALAGWLGDVAGIVLMATGIFGSGSESILGVMISTPIVAAKLLMWWQWTTPERTGQDLRAVGPSGRPEGFSARKATRLFGMVFLGVLFLEAISPLLGVGVVQRLPGGTAPVAAVSLGVTVAVLAIAEYTALAACFFATCIYLKQLARRANDASLLGYCQVTMIVAPVVATALGCVIIGLVVAWFLWWAMLIRAESTISSIVRARQAAVRLAERGGVAG